MECKTDFHDTIEHLSVRIGPRSPGSYAEKTAADWIADKFSEFGYQPVFEAFACPAHTAAKVILGGLENCDINIIPTQHSPVGCAAGEFIWLGFGDEIPAVSSLAGKVGLLAVQGDLHEYHRLLDGFEAAQLAGLIVIGAFATHANGKTVRSGRLKRMPVAAVSVNDGRKLRERVGCHITLDVIGSDINPAGSQNVIARLAGKSSQTVVVMAHYDSAAGCGGAVDNASGVAILLELAARLSGTVPHNNIEFVATGAEEFGGEDFCGCGAKAYFKNRIENLENIIACFEIDHVGDRLGVRRLRAWGSKGFLNDIAKFAPFIRDEQRPVGGDGGAAYRFGLPSVSMTDKFIPAPYYHTAADAIDIIDIDALKLASDVGVKILSSLCKAGPDLRYARYGDVVIRPARETDIDRICEITRNAFGPVSTDRMREEFFSTKLGGLDWWKHKTANVREFVIKYMDWVLVAETDGLVVGFASYILDGRRRLAEVGNNSVAPAYQGRGIGKLMQQEVFRRFDEEGYSMRTVSTLVEDMPARKIYERMGFQEITRSITYLNRS